MRRIVLRCATATRSARSRSGLAGSGRDGPGPQRRRRRGGPAHHLGALRRPRPADPGGDGPDARRRLDPALRRGREAGRLGGRGGVLLDLGIGGLPCLRRAHPHRPRRADGEATGRRSPGGDDDRRPRRRRPLSRRLPGDHDRGGEGPARALGGLERERHPGRGPAQRSGRPRPGPRAGGSSS